MPTLDSFSERLEQALARVACLERTSESLRQDVREVREQLRAQSDQQRKDYSSAISGFRMELGSALELKAQIVEALRAESRSQFGDVWHSLRSMQDCMWKIDAAESPDGVALSGAIVDSGGSNSEARPEKGNEEDVLEENAAGGEGQGLLGSRVPAKGSASQAVLKDATDRAEKALMAEVRALVYKETTAAKAALSQSVSDSVKAFLKSTSNGDTHLLRLRVEALERRMAQGGGLSFAGLRDVQPAKAASRPQDPVTPAVCQSKGETPSSTTTMAPSPATDDGGDPYASPIPKNERSKKESLFLQGLERLEGLAAGVTTAGAARSTCTSSTSAPLTVATFEAAPGRTTTTPRASEVPSVRAELHNLFVDQKTPPAAMTTTATTATTVLSHIGHGFHDQSAQAGKAQPARVRPLSLPPREVSAPATPRATSPRDVQPPSSLPQLPQWPASTGSSMRRGYSDGRRMAPEPGHEVRRQYSDGPAAPGLGQRTSVTVDLTGVAKPALQMSGSILPGSRSWGSTPRATMRSVKVVAPQIHETRQVSPHGCALPQGMPQGVGLMHIPQSTTQGLVPGAPLPGATTCGSISVPVASTRGRH